MFENESKIFHREIIVIRKAQQHTKPAGRRDEYFEYFISGFPLFCAISLDVFFFISTVKNLSCHRELEFLLICVGPASVDGDKADVRLHRSGFSTSNLSMVMIHDRWCDMSTVLRYASGEKGEDPFTLFRGS